MVALLQSGWAGMNFFKILGIEFLDIVGIAGLNIAGISFFNLTGIQCLNHTSYKIPLRDSDSWDSRGILGLRLLGVWLGSWLW